MTVPTRRNKTKKAMSCKQAQGENIAIEWQNNEQLTRNNYLCCFIIIFFFLVTHNPYTYFTSLQSLNSAANYLVSAGFYVILYIIWSCMSGPRCLCLIFHFENIFSIFWLKQTIYSPHVLDFVVLQDACKTKVHELFSGTLHLRFSCR